jgi:hypothetical protein
MLLSARPYCSYFGMIRGDCQSVKCKNSKGNSYIQTGRSRCRACPRNRLSRDEASKHSGSPPRNPASTRLTVYSQRRSFGGRGSCSPLVPGPCDKAELDQQLSTDEGLRQASGAPTVAKSRLQCGGLNRDEVENAKFLGERRSDPLGLESCADTGGDLAKRRQGYRRGWAVELRKDAIRTPTSL